MEFSMADQSTEPFAWMVEGISRDDVRAVGAEQYVREYAESSIDGLGLDTTVDEWMADSYEYENAVRFIREWLDEDEG